MTPELAPKVRASPVTRLIAEVLDLWRKEELDDREALEDIEDIVNSWEKE